MCSVTYEYLVLLTGLIKKFGHRKEIRVPADVSNVAFRQSESMGQRRSLRVPNYLNKTKQFFYSLTDVAPQFCFEQQTCTLLKLYFHWTVITCCCIVFLGLATLFCCSLFCSLDQPCKTLQTVQGAVSRKSR